MMVAALATLAPFIGGADTDPDVEHPLPSLDTERCDEIPRGVCEPGRVHTFVDLRDTVVGAPILHPGSLPVHRTYAGPRLDSRAMRTGGA